MSGPFEDLRCAVRPLSRPPGFAVTAVVMLALGIGTNTALFRVVNAVLRHAAGADHPQRIAGIDAPGSQFPLPVHAALGSLDQVEAASVEGPAPCNILDNGKAEHIRAAAAAARCFRLFGAPPILDRTFTAEKEQANARYV